MTAARHLHLVTAEELQVAPPTPSPVPKPRAPYVAQWMIDEGEAAFRGRRAARLRRWAMATAVVAAIAWAAWAALRP